MRRTSTRSCTPVAPEPAFACPPRAPSASGLCDVRVHHVERKRSGASISTIFATSFLPEATTRMSRRPKRGFAASTIRLAVSFRDAGRLLSGSTSASQSRHLAAISSSSFALPAVQHEFSSHSSQDCRGQAPNAPEAPVTIATFLSRQRARADRRSLGSRDSLPADRG